MLSKVLEMNRKILHKFQAVFTGEVQNDGVDLKAYVKNVNSGIWRDKMVFGISQATGKFEFVDPVLVPGCAFVGGMGSGKSIAMRHMIATSLATNHDNTIYILFDSEKSMLDYAMLFKYPQVVPALGSIDKFIIVMDLLWEECQQRNREFRRVGAANIYKYEEILKDKNSEFYDPNFKSIARYQLCIEEFHAITNSKLIKLFDNYDKEGTAAWQLFKLMRVGRSYGMFVNIATQRPTSDDIPSNFKAGLNNFFLFYTMNQGDCTAVGLPDAANIRKGQNGRCVSEKGPMQFPFIKEPSKLLDPRVKPLVAKTLSHPVQSYKKATEAEGTSGMVWVKPLQFSITAIEQFDAKDVVAKILSIFGFESSVQTNMSLVADMIATKDGEKYAVVISKQSNDGYRSQRNDKSTKALEESLPILGVNKIISVSFSGSSDMSSLIDKHGGYNIDQAELKRIYEIVDNKTFAESDPENYSKLFSGLKLAKKPEAPETKKEDVATDSKDEDPLSAIKNRFSKRAAIVVEED